MSVTNVSINQPLYGASFVQAITRFFKKYFTFSGRASRSEFWWVFLAVAVVQILLSMFFGSSVDINPANNTPRYNPGSIPSTIIGLAILIPNLALIWRRLHDTNKSGLFFLLALIPFVGWIILIILLALKTDPAGVRFDK